MACCKSRPASFAMHFQRTATLNSKASRMAKHRVWRTDQVSDFAQAYKP